MNEEQKIELIEKYLQSRLTDDEKRLFERIRKEDASFNDEIEKHRLLIRGIRQSARMEMKAKVKSEIQKLKSSNGKVVSMKKYIPYSIAALILVVAGVALIFKLTYRNPVERILSQAPSLEKFQNEIDSNDLSLPSIFPVQEQAFGFVGKDTIDFPDEKLSEMYRNGTTAFDAGNYKSCIDFLMPITKTFDHPYVYSKIGEAYMHLEKYEDAVKYFDIAINLHYKYSDAYLNKGYCLAHLGKHSAAIESANLAVHYDSTNFMAYYNRGLSRWHNQDIADVHRRDLLKAADDFTLSIRFQPLETDFDSAYYSRGLAYVNLGFLTKALPDFDNAIKINPDRADSYFFKGICLFYMEQYEDALPAFNKAKEKGSSREDLLSYVDWTEKIVEERRKSGIVKG